MLVTATITVGVDIVNPIEVYSAPDINLLNILADKYEGKCYFNYYIVKVKRIIRRSECMIQAGSDPIGKITVIIEIDAIRYNAGDIITNCVVKNKDKSNIIIATGPNCAVYLDTQDIFTAIKKDHIITVRVGTAKYSPGSDKISINAYPYVPEKKPIVYQVIDEKINIDMHKDLLDEIAREEKHTDEVRKKNAKGMEFFRTMTYPFKKVEKPKGKSVSVKELATKIQKGYYICDPLIHISDPDVMFADKYDGEVISQLSTDVVIFSLLKRYLDGMRVVCEMTEIYRDDEVMKEHMALWTIYSKLKE